VTRLMIFVQHPRHVSSADAESWLEDQLEALAGDGVEEVGLRRLCTASPRLGAPSAWMFELECRDLQAAQEAVGDGAGRALLGDLRLLGMHPSVAVVDDGP
jgi:hypothetical protein